MSHIEALLEVDERGGAVLLNKNYLSESIVSTDFSTRNKFGPSSDIHRSTYLFFFSYVPQADSRYYSHDSFFSTQEKLKTRDTCKMSFVYWET